MTTVHLLQKLGVYIQPNFLSCEEANRVCAQMMNSSVWQAGIYSSVTEQEASQPEIRKTLYCKVSDAEHQHLVAKIQSTRAGLEKHFDVQLSDTRFEPPKYLRYDQGHFFAPHTDDQLNRRINITINLNSPEPQHTMNEEYGTGFEGGDLMLYGLMKTSGFHKKGIKAPSVQGCLIAYPVDVVHEVTPVIKGSRFAVVSRFLSA